MAHAIHDLYYRHEADFRHIPSVARQAFLAGCVQYDPPPGQLLAFADHALPFLAPRRPVTGSWALPDRHPNAVGLPIEWVPYGPDVEVVATLKERAAAECEMGAFKDALREELRGRGLDPEPILRKAARQSGLHLPAHIAAQAARWRAEPHHCPYTLADEIARDATPHVRVDDVTSVDDAKAAASYIKKLRGTTNNKPKRHALACVQCAIWRDDLHWTYARIAGEMGWQTQDNYSGSPRRSETARAHVAEGRKLRDQQKTSTTDL
jgi:hypothetical protein